MQWDDGIIPPRVLDVADYFRVVIDITVLLHTLPAILNIASGSNDRVDIILRSPGTKQSSSRI